jgi:pyruvate dehydrogenase E2 component (dihydrolipoamide acetyltransferase)
MNVEFTMPQLGLTMTEGTVTKWLKKVGDPIVAGDPLVEISTDKITSEIEATASGTLLKILVPEGDIAPVQAPLAVIGELREDIVMPHASALAKAAAPILREPDHPTEADEGATKAVKHPAEIADGWIVASPLARNVARQRNIDLAYVKGTGPGKRVLERDVLAFAASPSPMARVAPLAEKIASKHGVDLACLDRAERQIMEADVVTHFPQLAHASVPTVAPAGTPLTGMRKIIAERMSLSWQTAPHVHLTIEVDMSEVIQLQKELAANLKISLTDFIVKYAAQSLTEFRMVNNRLADGRLIENPTINIGIAVGLDNGLIVPVIRNADRKSLRALSEERIGLVAKARERKLLPEDYAGGTFTISNLGMYGVDHFTPVINPPESAVLGVCRCAERAMVVGKAVTIRPMMNLCLAFDHRLIDGVLAARFMSRLRQYLEMPMLL